MNLLSPVRISFLRSISLATKSTSIQWKVLSNINGAPISHNCRSSMFYSSYKTTENSLSSIQRYYCVKANKNEKPIIDEKNSTTKGGIISELNNNQNDKINIKTPDAESLTLFQRFKKMYKEYWYVLLPVHVVTSAAWFGGFYYAIESGVDIIGIMESIGFSEKYINPIRDSKLGHVAIAYLLYKVATPLRYTVTLGGTTVSINYLVKKGYIKPVPSREVLIQKYKDRRDAKPITNQEGKVIFVYETNSKSKM